MGRLNKSVFPKNGIEKPREKAIREGISTLSDSELVALLLDTGSKKENVVQLSSRMLFEKGGLKGIFTSDVPLETYGVKKAKSHRLLAVKEIIKRLPLTSYKKIMKTEDAFLATKGIFLGKKTEVAVVIYLDRNKNVLFLQTYDFDMPGKAIVPIDKIIKDFVRLSASFVLLVHNHPSGKLLASDADIYVSVKLSKHISYVGGVLLDSIIVNDYAYLSFRQRQIEPYK